MECLIDVTILTRDINGNKEFHYLTWNMVCEYFKNADEEDQILLVMVDGSCIYSALANPPITWVDLIGYFA